MDCGLGFGLNSGKVTVDSLTRILDILPSRRLRRVLDFQEFATTNAAVHRSADHLGHQMDQSTFAVLRRETTALSRIASQSHFQMFKRANETFERAARQQRELLRAVTPATPTMHNAMIAPMAQIERNLARNALMTGEFLTLPRVHQSWLDQVSGAAHDIAQLNVQTTVQAMRQIDFLGLTVRYPMQLDTMTKLQSAVGQMTASYSELAESLRDISDVVRLPSFVLPGATRELYSTRHVLETLLRPDRADHEDSELEYRFEHQQESAELVALLEQLGPGFVRPYRGALASLYDDNPDRTRHILDSLRELCDHTIRRLAPTDRVTDWVEAVGDQELLHDERPTRRGRVSYILRHIDSDSRVVSRLFEIFGRSHELEHSIAETQLEGLVSRVESFLAYLLKAAGFHWR